MSYIVTKPTKSRGIAILLVALFGPIGMLYSTIVGALVMIICWPILVLGLLYKAHYDFSSHFYEVVVIFWSIIAYIICFLWAVSAVQDYNNKIKEVAYLANSDNSDNNYIEERQRNNKVSWIIVIVTVIIALMMYIKQEALFKKQSNKAEVTKETPSITEPIDQPIKQKSQTSKKVKDENYRSSEISYTGRWYNTESSIDDYVIKLQLQENNLKVFGTLDKYKISGEVREQLDVEDILRRELVGFLYDNSGKKIASISFDLDGNYEGKWNKELEFHIKETYHDFKYVDYMIFRQ